MSNEMEQLYQQVILDHSKFPKGKGLQELIEGLAGAESFQKNPSCGDEVTMRVSFTGSADDAVIEQLTWDGMGCSISQASISVLSDLVAGKTVTEAEEIAELFRQLMDTRGKGFPDDEHLEEKEDTLGDASAFTGVSKFPARIKCALLGWSALKDTINKAGVAPNADA